MNLSLGRAVRKVGRRGRGYLQTGTFYSIYFWIWEALTGPRSCIAMAGQKCYYVIGAVLEASVIG